MVLTLSDRPTYAHGPKVRKIDLLAQSRPAQRSQQVSHLAEPAVASAASGPRVRVVALVLTALAALAGIASVARMLLDPDSVLGPIAAAAAGRTGSLETTSDVGAWPWVAILGFVLAALALGGLATARRAARGLPSRYDAPGRPPQSDWDQLSAGEDPTDVGPAPRT